jgi:SOS regulatory protein LexA
MGRVEKTIFISYRRENAPWAIAIYQYLTSHGFDAFYDFQNVDSGNFEKVIIENIKARAHFIIVLTPSALDNCKEPDDWLRREIETAMDEKRNIVPLMLENFDFGSPLIKRKLTGKLSPLKGYNGLRIYAEYFFEGMEKLSQRFLNIELSDIPLQPLTPKTKVITEANKAAASEVAQIETSQLLNQEQLEIKNLRIHIPIIGRISAGTPIQTPSIDFNYLDAEESVEIAYNLLPQQVKGKDLFALEVQGDSMIDAMVNDGDIVVMKQAQRANNGDMVAVWLPYKNETTLKFFFEEKDRYRLQPANPTMKPLFIKKDERLEIKGKVVMVIRKVEKQS